MKNLLKSVLMIPAMVLAMVSSAQVPVLSSYPSASPTIFLDFDGESFTGTTWNILAPVITCEATPHTTAQITEIFNRVAEDFRPFKINVTTDVAKYNAAPGNRRMRVVLTISSSWYGNGAGGVSFINSFSTADDDPCFVFTALLGNNNLKRIAEAASHEAGHTLGMYHQAKYDASCNYISDYNAGTGTGEIGWAPIMGVGYYQNFTLWHNGPNPYSCTQQNDLDIITSAANGIVFRTDDHNSAFNLATSNSFVNNQFTASGIIERNTDQDMFKFTMPTAARFTLNAIPYNVGTGNSGSDLDMQITLFNNSQTQINVYNPGALLSSVIDSVLNPGTYYLRVEGRGNAYAPAYASLGSYSLEGNFGAGDPLPLRRLELNGSLHGSKHQLKWLIDADEQVTDLSVEVSSDGRNFGPLYQSGVDDRAFAYTPFAAANYQYRLNVRFDNGKQYYSNIVSLRGNANTPKPQLAGTVVYNNTITVSSPGLFQYSIHDLNGRTVNRGTITNGVNKITSSGLINGMYIIRFAKDDEQWIEKFVRQ
jgi:hypothetical protein